MTTETPPDIPLIYECAHCGWVAYSHDPLVHCPGCGKGDWV